MGLWLGEWNISNFNDSYKCGKEGLESLRARGPYALLVADMSMPGMDGVEFLERAKEFAPDAVRMMLTGNADQQEAKSRPSQHVGQACGDGLEVVGVHAGASPVNCVRVSLP